MISTATEADKAQITDSQRGQRYSTRRRYNRQLIINGGKTFIEAETKLVSAVYLPFTMNFSTTKSEVIEDTFMASSPKYNCSSLYLGEVARAAGRRG